MRAPTTATPTPLRTRLVTFRLDDLRALTARGVWVSTDRRDAVNALRVALAPEEWDGLSLGDAGRNDALARLLERRLETILNPLRRTSTAVSVEDLDPEGAIEQPPVRHGGTPGEPAQGEIRWGCQRVGVIYVREVGEEPAGGERP